MLTNEGVNYKAWIYHNIHDLFDAGEYGEYCAQIL